MSEQQLYGAQILSATIDQGGLCPAHRMRCIHCRIEANLGDPGMYDACILPRRQMRGLGSDTTGKQEILGLQLCCPDPSQQSILGLVRDFELDRTLGLLLHHDSARGNPGPMRNVTNAQLDQVASSELAVDAEMNSASSLSRFPN